MNPLPSYSFSSAQAATEASAFNAKLQVFSQRVGHICNLETAGKISSEEAFQQIERLWQQMEKLKQQFQREHPDIQLDADIFDLDFADALV